MGKRFSPTVVGIFVIGAVALAIVGVAVFGSGQFFRDTSRFVVFFQGSVNGLRIGAPVKVKGVQVGEVIDIRLGIGDVNLFGMEPPRIPVIIELDITGIRSRGATGDAGASSVKRLIEEGLRAQLNMESFVTGLLYVSFDFFPDAPLELVGGDDLPYPELPAIPTALEQAQSAAAEIINKLKEMKFDEMVADLRGAADGVNKLVNSAGLKQGVDSLGEVAANVNKALVDLRATLARLDKLGGNLDSGIVTVQKELAATTVEARRMLEQATLSLQNVGSLTRPDAPLAQQLGTTLRDVSRASQQLSNFLDYLERNPSALVRGKGVPEDK
jgi:paraquat-inducible protein B